MAKEESSGTFPPSIRLAALVVGPLLAACMYFWWLPDSYVNAAGQTVAFSSAGRACLGMVAWMALWWLTECVPIPVTAMLPLIFFPAFGITTPAAAMAPYASGTIFLFLGGFLLAAGIQRWGLDRRFAFDILWLIGTKPSQIIAAVMTATGFISAWVSNTATAAMMLPIAMAICTVVRISRGDQPMDKAEKNFNICILLALAYGASLGGMATLIGSPPNGIFARFVEQTYNTDITVVDWMKAGVPCALIFLPLCWFVLTKIVFRGMIKEVPGGREWLAKERAKLGPLNAGEKAVAVVFMVTVLAWVLAPVFRPMVIGGIKPFSAVSDAVIAMAGGLSLFAIPLNRNGSVRVITWRDCDTISWDVLLLFGGGLSMAAAIQSSGAAALIGAQATAFAGLAPQVAMFCLTDMVEFATEFTSNTALAATMMPLINAAAPAMGLPVNQLLLAVALAASCAFMTPVGTPPNAIVFGTGHIKITDMVKAGIIMNLTCAVVISLLATFLADYVFPIPMP